jgi:MFS-type transporter involved in bile tolerance (Atg22 family)
MLLFCYAPDAFWFGLAFVLWGIATMVGGAAPAAYAGDTAPKGMNAAALSTYRMTGDAGYVLGPFVMGLLVDVYSTTVALLIGTAMTIGAGVAFMVWAPESHRGKPG